MTGTRQNESAQSFEIILGETLSDVAFVLDYWQLQFDGPTINVMTPIELHDDAGSVNDGQFRFRERLSGQLGKAVIGTELSATALTITFEDRSTIAVSLREEDYHGPEAIVLMDAGRRLLLAL